VDDIASPGHPRARLPTLTSYLSMVRDHVVIITVTTLVGLVGGVALELREVPVFQASASIELPDVPTFVDVVPEDVIPQRTTIDSTAQLVFATPVVDKVATVTRLNPAIVQKNLSVSAYPLSRVLITTFQARTPTLAIAGANQAAQALIDVRNRALLGERLGNATRLAHRLNALIKLADARVGPYNPISRRLRDQLIQINTVRQEADNGRARIVDDAFPAHRVRSHAHLESTTGAVIGLMAGLAISWWRPARQRRVLQR
jgi:hypothetical protein